MPDTTFSDENVYHFSQEKTENEHAASIRYIHKEGHGDKYRQARDVPVTLRKDQSSRLRPHGSEENAKLFKVPSSRSIHHLERNKMDRAGAEPRFGVPKKDNDTEEKKKRDAAALLSRVLRVFFPDGPFMSHVKQLSTQRPSLTPPEVMAQARADLGRGPEPVQQNLTINQFLQLNQLTQQIVLSQLTPDQVQQLYGNVNEARGIQGLPPLITPTADPKVWIEAVDSDDEDEGKQDTAGVSSLSFQNPPMDSEDEDDGSNPVVLQPAFPIQDVFPIQEGDIIGEEEEKMTESERNSSKQSREVMNNAVKEYEATPKKDRKRIRDLVRVFVNQLESSYNMGKAQFYEDLMSGKLVQNSTDYYNLKSTWKKTMSESGKDFGAMQWRDLFRLFHAIISDTLQFATKEESSELRSLTKFLDGLPAATTRGRGVVQAGTGRGSTPWIELVKKVQRERGVSYKEALKLASRIR